MKKKILKIIIFCSFLKSEYKITINFSKTTVWSGFPNYLFWNKSKNSQQIYTMESFFDNVVANFKT